MSHPRDPQITSNNDYFKYLAYQNFFEMSRDDHPRHSYKHVYFKYLAYQNFFEMSRDDHPRHSYKHVHFKYLAYLTSKRLEIFSQTPNYLKLVQKIWNRKYLYNCKLYTIEVVLMDPNSGQDALKHILRHAKHSQSQSETRTKKPQEEERPHMCQPIQALLYHNAQDCDIPCNVFAMQNVWCTI